MEITGTLLIALIAVAIVSGIVIIFCIYWFGYRKLIDVLTNSSNIVVHSAWITQIHSQNWIWPELLKDSVSTSAGELLREMHENLENGPKSGVPPETGPRVSESVAKYATFKKDNFQKTATKAILQVYKLKNIVPTIIKKSAESKNRVQDEEVGKFNVRSVKFKYWKDFNWFLKLKLIRHSNILVFKHVSFEQDKMMILYELAGKNTLEDVLQSRRFNFNTRIQQSMIRDLIEAMSYISTSNLKSHGNLNPRNIYIDDYFVLKIGGFGVFSYVEGCHQIGVKDYYDRVFMAPEILSDYPDHCAGTIKGDIFRFVHHCL